MSLVDYFSCEPPQEVIPPVGVFQEMIHEPGGCERHIEELIQRLVRHICILSILDNDFSHLFLFCVLSGQHLPFLTKFPLFKGLSEDQHLPSDLPYTSLRPPIILLPSSFLTGGLWEVYVRCCTKTSRPEVPLHKGISNDLGRC